MKAPFSRFEASRAPAAQGQAGAAAARMDHNLLAECAGVEEFLGGAGGAVAVGGGGRGAAQQAPAMTSAGGVLGLMQTGSGAVAAAAASSPVGQAAGAKAEDDGGDTRDTALADLAGEENFARFCRLLDEVNPATCSFVRQRGWNRACLKSGALVARRHGRTSASSVALLRSASFDGVEERRCATRWFSWAILKLKTWVRGTKHVNWWRRCALRFSSRRFASSGANPPNRPGANGRTVPSAARRCSPRSMNIPRKCSRMTP